MTLIILTFSNCPSARETLEHFDSDMKLRLVIIKTLILMMVYSVTLTAGLLVFQMRVCGLTWAPLGSPGLTP